MPYHEETRKAAKTPRALTDIFGDFGAFGDFVMSRDAG